MKTKPGQGEKFTKMEDSSPVSYHVIIPRVSATLSVKLKFIC